MLYGLDIGGTKTELCAFDNNQCVFSKRVSTPTDSYTAFQATIKQLVTEADTTLSYKGTIGIGIPGYIEPLSGRARCSNVPCTNGKPLHDDLERILKRPVKIENDANCFVLSEAIGGAGDGLDSVFGVILGTGCGGGLFLNGKLYTGHNNLAGEWGHTPLPYSVFEIASKDLPIVQCGCGLYGCLDNYLSGRGATLIYHHLTGSMKEGKSIVQAYRQHQTHAVQTVKIYCELLASGLASMVNTLDPSMIVLGGGLSNFDELYTLLPPLIKKYTLKTGKLPDIRKAVYGDSSGVRGAAMLHR